jgi:hypothetical protein
MSYYMGDYRGDFYMGDPGIGSFFKKVIGGAASFIPGVGPLISRGIAAIPGGRRVTQAIVPRITAAAAATTSAIVKHPVLSAAGAAGALAAGGEMMSMGRGVPSAGMKGYHISKSRHSKHFGQLVRNRRMNVANGRALARATRRLHAFARRYRKVIGFVSPRKPKGRIYFKKRHRRAA